MNRARDLMLTGVLMLSAGSSAGLGPGDLTITYRTAEGVTVNHYYAAGRARVQDATSDTIIDFDSKRVLTIDHSRRQYTELTFAEVEEASRAAAAYMQQSLDRIPQESRADTRRRLGGSTAEPVVKKGAARTIAGLSCQTFTVTMGDGMLQETCNTADLVPPFDWTVFQKVSQVDVPTVEGMDRFARAVSGIKGVVLFQRVVLSVLGQKIESRFEATEVRKGPIDPALFALPSGYRRTPPSKSRP